MSEAENTKQGILPMAEDVDLQSRIFRTMTVAVALAVAVSVSFASWQTTTGLLLGGLLSLLNHHWLRTSIAAALSLSMEGVRPRLKVTRYLLRYLVIAALVYASYKLNIASLPATIAGLCSFVVALFGEAFRQLYLAIIHREEIS